MSLTVVKAVQGSLGSGLTSTYFSVSGFEHMTVKTHAQDNVRTERKAR